jgi:hypothetical protein
MNQLATTSSEEPYDFNHNGFHPKDRFGVICLRMSGIIDHVNLAQNLLPRIKRCYERHKEIRLAIYYDDYQGWQEQDFASDALQLNPFRHHIRKVALINPPEEAKEHFTTQWPTNHKNVRQFDENSMDEALLWVNS